MGRSRGRNWRRLKSERLSVFSCQSLVFSFFGSWRLVISLWLWFFALGISLSVVRDWWRVRKPSDGRNEGDMNFMIKTKPRNPAPVAEPETGRPAGTGEEWLGRNRSSKRRLWERLNPRSRRDRESGG